MTFADDLCAALADPNVISAVKNIIGSQMTESIQFYEDRIKKCEEKLEERETTINNLEDKLKNQMNINSTLEQEIDQLEQYSRLNSVKILNPGWIEREDENCTDLVIDYGKKHGLDLTHSDFDACHRVGKVQNNATVRPILAKLIRRDHRTKLLLSRTQERTARSGIYVNEDITQRRAAAAKLARDLVKMKKISNSYVYYGKVVIIRNDNSKHIITHVDELSKYQ